MRHRALVEALRLARPVPFAPGGAPGVAGPSLTALSLPTTRSAVGQPSTSRSLPLLLLSLRPASGLAGRGLACPPHGGQEASSSSKHSTPNPAAPDHDPAGDAAYHSAADDALHALLDGLEAWVDDTPGLEDADVEYSSGVLTLSLGPGKGTYVLNKQAPNRQLWLSSPVSGPIRYDCVDGRWVYARDGHCLMDKLREELAGLTGGGGPAI